MEASGFPRFLVLAKKKKNGRLIVNALFFSYLIKMASPPLLSLHTDLLNNQIFLVQ